MNKAYSTLNEYYNRDMNNEIVRAAVGGYDGRVYVVAGKLDKNEDGTVNREMSSQWVTIRNDKGKHVPVSVKFVEDYETLSSEEAKIQTEEIISRPIVARQENEEVRPYENGEVISADISGNGVLFTGEIAGTDNLGNYIVVDPMTGQKVSVEPRQIVNTDNLSGIEDGSLIEYRNDNGDISGGVVGSMSALRPQGLIVMENGDEVPIENVIGLAEKSGEEEGNRKGKNTEIEEIRKRSPKRIVGKGESKREETDYDALMESNPEDFAVLYESEEGKEKTRDELLSVSANLTKRIEGERKKLNESTSINQRKDAQNSLSELTERKERIDGIIQSRYTDLEKEASPDSKTTDTTLSEKPEEGDTTRSSDNVSEEKGTENDSKTQEETDNLPLTEEQAKLKNRIRSWLSEENLQGALGKTRAEIFDEFGNELEPIAIINPDYLQYLGDGVTDNHVYSGKGYFIDHAINHHPNISVKEYDNIQDILDNPDDIKLDTEREKPSLIFIKQYGKYGVVVVNTDVGEEGKIVFHKTFFLQKKKPYASLPSIRPESLSLGDDIQLDGRNSPISPADAPTAAVSRFSGLNDNDKDTANNSKNNNNERENEEIDREDEKAGVLTRDVMPDTKIPEEFATTSGTMEVTSNDGDAKMPTPYPTMEPYRNTSDSKGNVKMGTFKPKRAKKVSERQKFLSGVDYESLSMRGKVLYDIASDGVKFKWNDDRTEGGSVRSYGMGSSLIATKGSK
ncbi:MAG: hypothetical protein LBH12_02140, partial [Dysgonamonadaceae bacterium]|nr:hypothetical protein [Dysgonamonadaceae bacterium]